MSGLLYKHLKIVDAVRLNYSKQDKDWSINSQYLGNPRANILLCRSHTSTPYLPLVYFGVELELGPPVKYYHMGWPSELESSNLLPLRYILPLFNNRDTTWNLNHSYLYHCYSAYGFILSINNKNEPRWNTG